MTHLATLLGFEWDDPLDPSISQPLANSLALIRPVRGYRLNLPKFSAPSSSSSLLNDFFEEEGVVSLPLAGDKPKNRASTVAHDMKFRRHSSPRSAKIMVIWFLRSPFFPAPEAAR